LWRLRHNTGRLEGRVDLAHLHHSMSHDPNVVEDAQLARVSPSAGKKRSAQRHAMRPRPISQALD
jgi:hypothetical protein